MFKTTHNPVTKAVLVLLALGMLAPLPLAAAKDDTKDSKPTSLYLDVEKGDHLIGGLKQGNFRLFVDGNHRDFHLEPLQKPATIALLVEYSQASWYYFNDILEAMQGFMNTAPKGNWYALVTFSQQTTIQVDFTKQRGKIASAFSDLGMPSWNEIDTYDAVYKTLVKLSRLPGRRILIFIGSGFDTFSSHTLDDVQKKIEQSNIIVYGVGAGSVLRGQYRAYLNTMQQMDLLQARNFLQMMANKSGGQAWFPKFQSAFPDVVQGVMQDIKHQYRLVFKPQLPQDGQFHKVKVEAFALKGDQRVNFKVRVRDGWKTEK